MSSARIIIIIGVLALARTASAQTLLFSDERGPRDQAHDIVFVSEGYRASEKKDFENRARDMIAAMDSDLASPGRAHREGFNFHAVFVPSKDRAQAKWGGSPKDTAFKVAPRQNGLLTSDDVAADKAALAAPDVDVVVIVCRFGFSFFDAPPRACADVPPGGARVRIPEDQPATLIHELGHAVYSLGDEYADLQGAIPEAEKFFVTLFANLTCDPTGARFAPFAPPPYHEGGAHYPRGVWRCETRCRMRDGNSADEGFCAVCRAWIEGRPKTVPAPPSATVANGAVKITPAPGEASTRFEVRVKTIEEHPLQLFAAQVESSARTIALTLPPGDYTLMVDAGNPRGDSTWTTSTFTIAAPGSATPATPAPPATPPAPAPTPPAAAPALPTPGLIRKLGR